MDIKFYLEKLGLDEKEISVYLACLELGETSIVPIPPKVNLPRSTVYYILERLKNKGLINIIETRTRRLYVSNPPGTIMTLLKNKKEEIEETIDSFGHLLPELRRHYSLNPFQPKVRFFPSKEIRNIYEEVLLSPVDESWFVSDFNKLAEVLGEDYLRKWVEQRVGKKIRSKVILVATKTLKDPVFRPGSKFLRTARYAPSHFECPTHIAIYGDNVAIITTTGENFGTVITSREYANTMRNWFNELWKYSAQNSN